MSPRSSPAEIARCSYSNAEMNKLIAETNTSSSLAIYHTFATYAAEQLPSIWLPNSAQVYAVSKNLHAWSSTRSRPSCPSTGT